MTYDEENLDAIAQDVVDLLNLIKELEERIIKLEQTGVRVINPDDSWYWEHG